jgi:hypothetical protein
MFHSDLLDALYSVLRNGLNKHPLLALHIVVGGHAGLFIEAVKPDTIGSEAE